MFKVNFSDLTAWQDEVWEGLLAEEGSCPLMLLARAVVTEENIGILGPDFELGQEATAALRLYEYLDDEPDMDLIWDHFFALYDLDEETLDALIKANGGEEMGGEELLNLEYQIFRALLAHMDLELIDFISDISRSFLHHLGAHAYLLPCELQLHPAGRFGLEREGVELEEEELGEGERQVLEHLRASDSNEPLSCLHLTLETFGRARTLSLLIEDLEGDQIPDHTPLFTPIATDSRDVGLEELDGDMPFGLLLNELGEDRDREDPLRLLQVGLASEEEEEEEEEEELV